MRFRDYKTWQNQKILPQKSDYLNVYSKFRWKLFLCNDICKVHFSNKEAFQRRSLDIRSQVINSWEAWYCAWRMRHFKKIYTGCFENLAPRSKAELGIGIHQNHISMTLYQFQINMQIFRTSRFLPTSGHVIYFSRWSTFSWPISALSFGSAFEVRQVVGSLNIEQEFSLQLK